jgi:hypothetical protein
MFFGKQLLFGLQLPATLAPTLNTDCLSEWWLNCSVLVPKVIATRWRTLALLA